MFFVLKKAIMLFFFLSLVSCCPGRQLITIDNIYQGIYEINVQEQQWKDASFPNRFENGIPSYHEYKLGLQEIREAPKL